MGAFLLFVELFIVNNFYPILSNEIGMFGCFWILSAICLFGFIIAVLFLPETKGNDLNK